MSHQDVLTCFMIFDKAYKHIRHKEKKLINRIILRLSIDHA
jgi:hypothetical protein